MQLRTEEIISVTDVQRQAKDIFTKLANNTQDQFFVMRNNELTAVMLPIERYEALLDELEDLHLEAIALERMATFDPATAISHEAMLAEFTENKS